MNPRTPSLILVALLVAPTLAVLPFAAPPAAAVDTSGSPVPFVPVAARASVELHLDDRGTDTASQIRAVCAVSGTAGERQRCYMSPQSVASGEPAVFKTQAYTFTPSVPADPTQPPPTAEATARFLFDAFLDTTLHDGVRHPFRITAGTPAMVASVWVEVPQLPCGDGEQYNFVAIVRGGPTQANDPGAGTAELGRGGRWACTSTPLTPAGNRTALATTGPTRIEIPVGLDQETVIAEGGAIVLDLFVRVISATAPTSATWTLFYGHEQRDSRLQVLKANVIEAAVWLTGADDRGVVDTFDPSAASTTGRTLHVHAALLSPLGPVLVPGSTQEAPQVEYRILNSTDKVEDLLVTGDAGEAQTRRAPMVSVVGAAEDFGSLKVYAPGTVSEGDEEDKTPWVYRQGIEGGAYKAILSVNVGGTAFEITKDFAMGSFGYRFGLFAGETIAHRFNPGGSSTFLFDLTNSASLADVYSVTATVKESSPAGATWSVSVEGAQSPGAEGLSLPAGGRALVKVRVAPPSTAAPGDFVRVEVKAESIGSGAVQQLSQPLEAQLSTAIDQAGAVVYLGDSPAEARVGKQTNLTAFVWNRGSGTDSFNVLTPDAGIDKTRFKVTAVTARVSGVPSGDISPAIVGVRVNATTPEGATTNVTVQARPASLSSGAAPGVSIPIITVVQRDFDVSVVDASGELGLSSTRWLQYDVVVSGDVVDVDTAWAFHEFRLTNLGDRSEEFDAEIRSLRLTADAPDPVFGGTHGFPTDPDDPRRPTLMSSVAFDSPATGTNATTLKLQVGAGETRSFWLRVFSDNADGSEDFLDATLSASVRVSLADSGVTPRIIETTTVADNDRRDGFLAIEAVSREESGDGLLVEPNATKLFLTPGELDTAEFLVTEGAQDKESVRLKLGPDNAVASMLAAGWAFRLVGIDAEIQGPIKNKTDFIELPVNDVTGESFRMELQVTPPLSGIQQGEFFPFTIQAQGVEHPSNVRSLGYEGFIGAQFAFNLTSSAPAELTAHSGDIIALPLQVSNRGATEDTYDITATAPGPGWEVKARPATIIVPAGRTMTVAVEAKVGGSAGDISTIPASVKSRSTGRTADQVFTVRVQQAAGAVELSVRTAAGTGEGALDRVQTLAVAPGKSVSYTLVLKNAGTTAASMCLFSVVSVPDFTLPPGTNTCGDFTPFRSVPASETRDYSFVVTAPEDLLVGSRFPFVVRAQNTTTSLDFDQVLLYAVVEGVLAAEIEERTPTIVVPTGQEGCLNATLRNTGTQNATYVITSQFAVAGWLATLRPYDNGRLQAPVEPPVITLAKGGLRELCLEVAPPESAPPGATTTLDVIVTPQASPDVLDTFRVTAAVQQYGYTIAVQGANEGRGGPGESVKFLVDVTNTGNGEDRFRLQFADAAGGEPSLRTVSSLPNNVAARRLAAGETLRNVEVSVQVPPPVDDTRIADVPVSTTITAVSLGSEAVDEDDVASASTSVTTRVVPYVALDVDGDTAREVAVDADGDDGNGYEAFRDVDDAIADAGVTFEPVTTTALYAFTGRDGRTKHLVNPASKAAVYFDPDRPFAAPVNWTLDITGDTSPEYAIDDDFDGLVDGVYEPAKDVLHDAVSGDFKGFGRTESLVDTDDDGEYDTFVDASTGTVTTVTKKGDNYHIDSDGDGQTDTYYNAESGEIKEAAPTSFVDFLKTFWYFVVLFVVVIAVFVVIVVRRVA